ncbi:hypothetical protein ZWY2020_012868 [Hordeum vulgare]|nr:hypothetical protein ZWY2020_012868 [Hordeum vulgare]
MLDQPKKNYMLDHLPPPRLTKGKATEPSTSAAVAGEIDPTVPWYLQVCTLTRLRRHREALAVLRHADPSPPPHALALPSALICCTALSLPSGVAQVHALAAKRGLVPASDSYILSALLSSYCRLGLLPCSRQLLDEMPAASTPPATVLTAFNSLISGCALHALTPACFALFRRMRVHVAGLRFNAVTLLALLPVAPATVVPQLHALAARSGLASGTTVANCLISVYGRRSPGLARQVFDEMPLASRDLVSWTAVLSAHAQSGLAVDALELYRRMRGHGVEPDALTLVGVLSSCTHLVARSVGLDVDRHVRQRLPGFRANVQLCSALINFHARCGSLPQAQQLFDEMPRKSIVSWTALITGYGMHGHGDIAINLFQRMVSQGIRPDNVSMVALLSACSHAGKYEEGCKYFFAMESTYKLRPTLEHYACMLHHLVGTHSEKLAVPFSLLNTVDVEIVVMMNLRVCGDCHSLLKMASAIANRVFLVRDSSCFHRFEVGACPCQDYWRTNWIESSL